MKRYCQNARNAYKKKSSLTVQEIEEVEMLLFKWIEHEEFGTDLQIKATSSDWKKISKTDIQTPRVQQSIN